MGQTATKILRLHKPSTRTANGVYYRSDKGTYRMRKVIGVVDGVDVGELSIELGTKNHDDAIKFYDAVMAQADPQYPRPDILMQLKRGADGQKAKLTPEEVYHMVRGQKVRDQLSALNGDVRLKKALTEWLPNHRKSNGKPLRPATAKSYEGLIGNFLRKEWCPLNATVRDIPRVYTRFQAYYMPREANGTINKTKAMLRSFLRSTQSKNGKPSDMYHHITSMPSADRKPKDGAQGLMVDEVFMLLKNLDDRWRVITEFMVLAGANFSEYRNTWKVGFEFQDDRVLVRGTKNENRVDRYVPRLAAFKELSEHPEDYYLPAVQHFNRALKRGSPRLKAIGVDISSHDLRATYQQWLEEAGINDFRVKCYVGHSTMTVHERYKRSAKQKETQFLNTDRDLVTKYLTENKTAPRPVEKRTINYFEWSK